MQPSIVRGRMLKNNWKLLHHETLIDPRPDPFAVAAFAQNPVLGKWKTIDDETGRIKSVVEVSERDGRFTAKSLSCSGCQKRTRTPFAINARTTEKTSPPWAWKSFGTWCPCLEIGMGRWDHLRPEERQDLRLRNVVGRGQHGRAQSPRLHLFPVPHADLAAPVKSRIRATKKSAA